MSPEEIINKSVCEIVSTDTYSGNEPIIGGLFDSRMGVIENDKICKTCQQKNTFCPGHFGHIQLARPVFYIQFFDMIRKVLKCVCFRCSKLLIDPKSPFVTRMMSKKFSRQKRFDMVYKCCSKIKRCGGDNPDGCGAKLPNKLSKENIGKIIMEWKEDQSTVVKQTFTPEDVLIILKRISDEDANVLGFPKNINRPEHLICTVFPVPPPSVRPSVRNDTGQRCEDDLTHKLCDIIKTNAALKNKLANGVSSEQIDYWKILLQFHVATFVDNQIPGIPPAKQRTGRPLRSLTERLKSKEGRIRGNLMGKRVDFSARSVITPDPNIDIDELGVPLKMAMNLTFPEVVNKYNIQEMYKLVRNGADRYPGAKYIRTSNGASGYRTIRLKHFDENAITLKYGDIIDRHLRNGDTVLFNRQPSLHKMSMMAHRVRVMPYETFRLNVCCTPSYNADYDGDEMNMHVPQSLQTENELRILASVPTQIISPRDSSPIISVVQDIVVGLYRISKEQSYVNNKQFFNIMAGNSKFTGAYQNPILKYNGAKIWHGRQLLSSVINPLINLSGGKGVVIEDGMIKSGIVDKKFYQEMSYGLIQTVHNDLGMNECSALFDNTQRLICDWLVYNGFSVGISDLMINKSTSNKLKDEIKSLKVDVYKQIDDIHMGNFKNHTIMTNNDHFEALVNQRLDSATKTINNIGTENIKDDQNRMMNMINSKSKGNPINVSQMMGCVGQQSVEGKRIQYGFDSRTLPHFTRYDDGPEARGFVENSFIKGLTAQEFFFHAMGGREGLIDTAVKTSETGYLQRKLIKAMEDAKVNFDMTVRSAGGNIIQYQYGDDSVDAIKLEKHHLDYLAFDITLGTMEDQYLLTDNDNLRAILSDDVIKEFQSTPNWQTKMTDFFHQVLQDREFIITQMYKDKPEITVIHPVAAYRLIKSTKRMFDLENVTLPSDLNPMYVLNRVEELYKRCTPNPKFPCTKLMAIVIRHYFSPKKMVVHHKFTQAAFDYLVENFAHKYQESLVNPSEMVGVVAAQSIGEPSTQLTLNSVEYNTEIMVSENGKLREYRIGDWIENRIAKGDKSTYSYIERGDQTYTPISEEEDVKILSADEQGNVFWDSVDAVTKHLPINEDGTNTLIRVTTLSGNVSTVTKGESVITRQNNKLLKSCGANLKEGDYLIKCKVVPVPKECQLNMWDISEQVPKSEFVYMSEVDKALNIKAKHNARGSRHWWKQNIGVNFELPYTRSDGFVDAFLGIGGKSGRRTQLENRPACVYPKGGIYQSCHFPEVLPLDTETGFVIGAYLSEGCTTEHHVLISNNDDVFMDRIKAWLDRYEIHYHFDEGEKPKGYSRTIRVHSLVMARLFQSAFSREVVEDGPDLVTENADDVVDDVLEKLVYETHKDSKNSKGTVKTSSRTKHLPGWLLGAPDECLKGLIDGYFSGDGYVQKKTRSISAASVSRSLLEGVGMILQKFGVITSVRESPSNYKHAIKKGFQTTMMYNLNVNTHNSVLFARKFKICIDYKQLLLDNIAARTTTKDGMFGIVPDVVTSQGTENLSIKEVEEKLRLCENEKDRKVYEEILKDNVFYDRVVKVEEVRSRHTHVYDMTTRISRNFVDKMSTILNDTFHLSGVASASKAVRGVPRIKELLSVSKNIKAPSLTVYLRPEYREKYETAQRAMNSVQMTHIKDMVISSRIYYEPDPQTTDVQQDNGFMRAYSRFQQIDPTCADITSPWVLRFELDHAKMLEFGLDANDVHLALTMYCDDKVHCVFSDDNNENMVFRIRLTGNAITDVVTELKGLEFNIMEKIIISGISKIKKASINKKKSKILSKEAIFKVYEDFEEHVLETDGTNLVDVLGNKYVDNTRTISNDIMEIYETLGVEAARQALYNEIKDILNDSTSVNHRHIALLVDTMTCKGYLLSIDRHGINRSDIGPLAKCSFEETSDILIKAGIFGERDKITGVSANIILGQIAQCGTGDSKISMDTEAIDRLLSTEEEDIEGSDACEEGFCEDIEDCMIDFELKMGAPSGAIEKRTMDELVVY